jgi:hypothetical protein
MQVKGEPMTDLDWSVNYINIEYECGDEDAGGNYCPGHYNVYVRKNYGERELVDIIETLDELFDCLKEHFANKRKLPG